MTRLREASALQAIRMPRQRFLLCILSRCNIFRISAVVWSSTTQLALLLAVTVLEYLTV